MIINIRGTSGSGKTTLMRHFIDQGTDRVELFGRTLGPRKPEALEMLWNGIPVIVLGSYRNTCGGCDSIPKQDYVHQFIADYSATHHVVFEGLMISHIYGRYAEAAKADPDNWCFLMLGTDFDTCIEHIKQRRRDAGKDDFCKESVYKNARRTYDSTYRIRDKLTADGLQWHDIPLENRFDIFDNLMMDLLL